MCKDQGNEITVEVDRDLEDIIPKFLENTRDDIDAIRNALSESNMDEARRLGHSMKGYGSGYGFDYISSVGLAIEQNAKEGHGENITGQLDSLISYLSKVKIKYI